MNRSKIIRRAIAGLLIALTSVGVTGAVLATADQSIAGGPGGSEGHWPKPKP